MSRADATGADATEAHLERVAFVRERLGKIDGLSSALWWMSHDVDLLRPRRSFDDFCSAVEAIAEALDDATTGVYDALAEIEGFLSEATP